MTCQCGSDEHIQTVGEHQLLGLDGIRLVGVPVIRCASCDEIHRVMLPRLRDLEKLLTTALVRKRGRLVPQEFRWLRKRLRLKGTELAKMIGVGSSTISRWENEAAPISAFGDRLLRTIVAHKGSVPLFDVNDLSEIDDADQRPAAHLLPPVPRFCPGVHRWRPQRHL